MPDASFPALDAGRFVVPDPGRLIAPQATHPPRFLLLYGSPRERLYSRFLTKEAARLLEDLLTTTAASYITDRGFFVVDCAEVSAAFHSSAEFRDACPDTATCMQRRIA